MRLKRIVLTGFKSFPRKSVLEFGPSLNVIVGPNGAGKSNIIDAIKWALGTNSVKELRGNKLEDIIFSGTENRPPMNMAEVQLVFENNGAIPLEYDVIEIKRRYYRDGTGEFFINNTPCRLKDIVENFANTGILHSILDTGSISKLILSDQQKRRELFESVANIGKYREDRKDALQKLERTNGELEKLQTIFDEQMKFARSLRHQASRARAYRRIVEEIRELTYRIGCIDISRINSKLDDLRKRLEGLNRRLKKLEEEKNSLQEQREFLARKISEKQEILRAIEKEEKTYMDRFIEVRSELSRIQGTLENLKRNLEEYDNLKDLDIEEINIRYIEKEQQLNQVKEAVEKAGIIIRQMEDEKREIENGIWNTEIELTRITERMEGLKKREKAQLERIEGLNSEKNELKFILPELEEKLSDIQAKLEDNSKNLNRIFADMEKLQKERSTILRQREELDRKRMRIEEELNVLKNLNIESSRIPEKLKKNFEITTAIERVEIKKGYEIPVESALSSLMYAIVDKDDSISRMIEFSKKEGIGNVAFVCRDYVRKSNNVNLAEAVKNDPDGFISGVLSHFILVDSIEDGLKLYKKNGGFYVTPDGDVVIFGAVMLKGEGVGPVLKKSRIEDMEREIKELSRSINKKEKRLLEISKKVDGLNQNRKELERERDTITGEKSAIDMELSRNRYRLDELEKRLGEIRKELEAIEKEKTTLEDKEKDLKQQEENLKNKLNEIQEEEERKTREKNKLLTELEKVEGEYRQLEVTINRLERYEKIQEEMSDYKTRYEKLEVERNELEEKLRSISEQKNEGGNTLNNLRNQLNKINESIEASGRDILDASLEKEQVESEIKRLEVEKENIVQQVIRETEKTPIPQEGENLEELKGELDRLIKRKEGMKEVNILAVEEYEKIKEEIDRLQMQKKDLERAKEDIINAINSIDRRAEREFTRTINEIRRQFQRIFTRLFNGGQADIRLEGRSPLEADINIYARPPGKKMSQMELLSDGEKTLTAISLLIGVILTRNIGLVILDEIDAPLDEKNVERFLEVLREETGDSQIILITHNRRTMEEADYIYGVTMEEKGISSVLSMSKEVLI